MAERSKFQFRMRDLLWAMGLIGLSLGIGISATRMERATFDTFGLLISWVSAVCFFGGLGCLCRQLLVGTVGVFIAFVILGLLFVALVALTLARQGL